MDMLDLNAENKEDSQVIVPRTTANFLDSIVDPFNAEDPVQVPDGHNQKTLALQDWIDLEDYELDVPALANIAGVVFSWQIGMNELVGLSVTPNAVYQVIVMPFTEDGIVQTNLAATGLSSIIPDNYQTINGSSNSISTDAALVTSWRNFSTGIRLLPTIELITDSSTTAISSFYGGLIAPIALSKSVNDATNIMGIVRQAEHVQQYSNKFGVSARMDPFNDPGFLKLRTLGNWQSINHIDTGLWLLPIVVCRFTAVLGDTDTIPVKIQSQHWFDGPLVQPTPIFASLPPFDSNFQLLGRALEKDLVDYPVVTEGNSFGSFLNKAAKFSGVVSNLLDKTSEVLPPRVAKRVKRISKAAKRAQRIANFGQKVVKMKGDLNGV